MLKNAQRQQGSQKPPFESQKLSSVRETNQTLANQDSGLETDWCL
jgi:hypothetical protein